MVDAAQTCRETRRGWVGFIVNSVLPNTAVAFFCLALMSLSAGAQTAPDFGDLSAQATSARERGDVPHALELYSHALQLNPKWADGWWFLGSLDYGSGAYTNGRDALTHYLELTPDAPPALALRGLCEFETGQYPQSLADIERGIALGAANQPRNAQILRYHEALLLTRLGRFEDALKSYAFFAQKGITNPELFLAIGLAGLRMPLLPKDASADQQEMLTAVGNAAFQFLSGDEASAGKAFHGLFQQFPTTGNLHYLYGTLLYSTDPDSAINEFEQELKVNPGNQTAQVMAPWALLMKNRPAEALPYARQVAEKQPRMAAAQLVLGRALAETGSLTEGIQHLERALQLEPNNLEVHIALAKAYSRSGRDEDARRERLLCLQMTKDEATHVAQR
jgi:tetratricopeptide (TPR) repeat protein